MKRKNRYKYLCKICAYNKNMPYLSLCNKDCKHCMIGDRNGVCSCENTAESYEGFCPNFKYLQRGVI